MSRLVTMFRIAAILDDAGKHALAEALYEVMAKQTNLSPEGKSMLKEFFGFGVNGEEDFKTGDFGDKVPEADYQTKRDPFRDNPTERGPEPKSDMLAYVKATAAELESRGEYTLAHALRSEFGA